MHVVDHVIDSHAREQLKHYYLEHKATLPSFNPLITNQHYFRKQWTDTDLPQSLIKPVLDKVLNLAYEVEYVFFGGGTGDGFRLHVDTPAQDDQSRNYKIVIIPIDFEGTAKTVFFHNHWLGPKAGLRFAETNDDPSIDWSQRTGIRTITGSDLTNYDPDKPFDQHTQQQHIAHIPLKHLQGLTLDQVVEWRLGSALVFDRTQLHCTGTGHTHKIWITCFTLLAQ